jgi:hypothetical protein
MWCPVNVWWWKASLVLFSQLGWLCASHQCTLVCLVCTPHPWNSIRLSKDLSISVCSCTNAWGRESGSEPPVPLHCAPCWVRSAPLTILPDLMRVRCTLHLPFALSPGAVTEGCGGIDSAYQAPHSISPTNVLPVHPSHPPTFRCCLELYCCLSSSYRQQSSINQQKDE